MAREFGSRVEQNGVDECGLKRLEIISWMTRGFEGLIKKEGTQIKYSKMV